ncbi:MAG: PQQ-dependent sugar dehydrogenase [Pseudomonadota bacterium]
MIRPLILALCLVVLGNPVAAATLGLTRIVDDTGVANPIHVAAPPGDSDRLFILDRSGVIRIYDRSSGTLLATPFFDNSAVTATSGERGAYAIAFDRNFATTGRLYLSYVDNRGAGGAETHRVISVDASANPNVADAVSVRTVIDIPHTIDGSGNHYGGWIGVDTANTLLITTGDSGQQSDLENGSPLLGSILRIDPNGDDFPTDAGRNYAIPGDNVSPGGGPVTEVIAEGFRNPYRGGYDDATGTLLVGDVGQNRLEEVNIVEQGLNYGWPDFEGTLPFSTFFPPGTLFEDPAFEYVHGAEPIAGSSITGGEVYRGPLGALDGLYFFGDFISDRILSLEFDAASGTLSDLTRWDLDIDAGDITGLASFGQDGDGNLYVIDLFGDVFLVSSAEDVDRNVAVPLPASGLLLLGGLAALGAARYRRKAPTSSTWADQRN